MTRAVLFVFWCAQAVSVVLFMAGCLCLVGGAVVLWVMTGLAIGKQIHPVAGFVYLFGSIYLAARMERFLRIPFQLWLQLWQWADGLLSARKYIASTDLTRR